MILMAKAKPTKDKESSSPEDEDEKKLGKKLLHAREIDKTQAKRTIRLKKKLVKAKRRVVAAPATVFKKPRDIGIDVTPPEGACDDVICPFHGTLPVRGRIIEGIVVRDKMDKSIVVKREFRRFTPKYERYEKRTRIYTAYNPECIKATAGEKVKIMECRPLSKTKSFVVIECPRK